jgi:hypothetical protein
MQMFLYNFFKTLIVIIILFGNSLFCSSWSANIDEISKEQQAVLDRLRKFLAESSNISGSKQNKSDILKNNLLIYEDRIITKVRKLNAPLTTEKTALIYDMQDSDIQKKKFIAVWQRRNKNSLELLEYWREHPDKISDKPPLLIYNEKTKKMTDRDLYNILSKKEKLLEFYIKNPLVETNRLEYFLIEPADYSKSE